VLREYEALLDNDKKIFEAWLKDEPKAAALHGHFFLEQDSEQSG
jgi:hypothetical protein